MTIQSGNIWKILLFGIIAWMVPHFCR